MIVIDKLCYESKLRHVNAGVKLGYTAGVLLLCIAGKSMVAAGLVFLLNGWLTVRRGGISLSRYVRLLLVPAVFLFMGTAAIFINVSRYPLDAFAIPAGGWYLTGSLEGLRRGLRLCMTAAASVSCLYFLSLNTTMTDLLDVFRKLHVPGLVIEMMLLIYRFIFLLMETASAVMTAQECRLGNRDLRTGMRAFGEMGSAVLIRALKRSNKLYDAMESRCYDGTIRVLSEAEPPKRSQIMAAWLAVGMVCVVTIAERYIGWMK